MKFNIGTDLYEIQNSDADKIFEDSKRFTLSVIDHCESNKMELKNYLIILCHVHVILIIL